MDVPEIDPDQLRDITAKSIEKARDLVDGLKSVQEHEKAVLDDEPPLFVPGHSLR
jgi:hypothetical protein